MGTDAPLLDISPDNLVEFETAVRPVPQFDPEHPQMISQGPSMCVFNKQDPQEVLASWLFAQYLLTNDVQIAYAETEGYVPVTSKAQGDADYQDYLNSDAGGRAALSGEASGRQGCCWTTPPTPSPRRCSTAPPPCATPRAS